MKRGNIYVVWGEDPEHTYVIAAFSNEEKAQEFIKKYKIGLDYVFDPASGYNITKLKINDETEGINAVNRRMQEAKPFYALPSNVKYRPLPKGMTLQDLEKE